MDDFGTGTSSLANLLPFVTLKVDRSLIRDTEFDRCARALTSAVVSMAHALGLELIAEGVETQAQRTFLSDEGCHLFLGYLIGRPCDRSQLATQLPAAA